MTADLGPGRARGFRLLGADRAYYWSARKGTFGGNRRGALYGRLDCPAALHALSRPSAATFRRFRVFFADEATAQAAGFRPCARCLPAAYEAWKAGPRPGQAYPWARRPDEPAPRVGA
jgi:Metal binding domain of Ada